MGVGVVMKEIIGYHINDHTRHLGTARTIEIGSSTTGIGPLQGGEGFSNLRSGEQPGRVAPIHALTVTRSDRNRQCELRQEEKQRGQLPGTALAPQSTSYSSFALFGGSGRRDVVDFHKRYADPAIHAHDNGRVLTRNEIGKDGCLRRIGRSEPSSHHFS